MTEDEAKTKWCPFVRITAENDQWKTMTNREEPLLGPRESPAVSRCIGSACMAWRWTPLQVDDAYAEAVRKAADELGDTSSNRSKAVKHVNANRADYGLPTKPFAGYCGLAGKP